jgi:hypothetical protein
MTKKEIAEKLVEEQCKISSFNDKLEELGIRIELPMCDLVDFALDVLGVPKDNTVETMGKNNNIPTDKTFCRDYFFDALFDNEYSAKEYVEFVCKEMKWYKALPFAEE